MLLFDVDLYNQWRQIYNEQRQRSFYKKWHAWTNWFAWYPVRTEQNEWVWLETVECKGTFWGSKILFKSFKYRRI